MKMSKSGGRLLLQILGAPLLLLPGALVGCGTAINSASSSSQSGATQARAQPPAGPVLGYVWDAAGQSLRPVRGVPGASIVGSPVVSAAGQGIISAASSNISGTALFLDAKGEVFQAALSGGALSKVASIPGATALMPSNSGSYALVTAKDGAGMSSAAVISGLPKSPVVQNLSVAASQSGQSSILGGAASDTGTVVLAMGSEAGVSFVAFAGQGAGVPLATAQGFGGVQFVPGSDELVFADGASGALSAVAHVNTKPTVSVLSPAGGIAAPVALDITQNGRWVMAVNHSGNGLRADLSGATIPTKLHCGCAPTQVVAMNGGASGSTLRLVTADGGPLWVVDAGVVSPQVQFIPAIGPSPSPAIVTKNAM
jgi:hypothetical protein